MAIRSKYPKLRQITQAGEAIDALGGTFAVADLFAVDPRVISNWRSRGLPPDTYAAMAPALTALGIQFNPAQLFSQRTIPPYRVPKRPRGPGRPALAPTP